MLTRTGQEEARHLQADLDGTAGHAELAPGSAEAGVLVDDKPNPFLDGTDDPVACLYGRWPDNVVPMPPPRSRFSATDMLGHVFRTVCQAGTDAEPGLAVFGQGDGLDDGQRAERVRNCQRRNQLLAVVYPIDNITSFLGVHGEGRYASVAIVARDQHLVVAVSAGPTLAVAQRGELLIAQDDGPLIPPSQPVGGPILPGSYVLLSTPEAGRAACPAGCPRTAPYGTALPEPANPILLNGILLGGVEAGYQPDCTPLEGAASYLAAAGGRVILDAGRGKKLKHPHQVHDLLGHALRSGERVPSLIVARDDLSARRLLDRVRGCGSA